MYRSYLKRTGQPAPQRQPRRALAPRGGRSAAVVARAGPRREEEQDPCAVLVETACRSSGSNVKSVPAAGLDRLAAGLDAH